MEGLFKDNFKAVSALQPAVLKTLSPQAFLMIH
jgi:hypothetical protein